MIKRLISIFAVLSMVIGVLTGCTENASTEPDAQITDSLIRFSPEVYTLTPDAGTLVQALAVDGNIIIISRMESGGYQFSMFDLNDKSSSILVTMDVPWIGNVYATKDGRLQTFCMNDDGSISQISINAGQATFSQINIPEGLSDAYVMGVIEWGGNYLLQVPDKVYVTDLQGTILREYGPYKSAPEILVYDDGFYIISSNEKSIVVQNLWHDFSEIDSWEISGNYNFFYNGFPGAKDTICAYGSDIMYLLNIRTGERTAMSNFFSSGSNNRGFVCLSEDSYFSFYDNSPAIWKPATAENTTTLTVSTYSGIREEWDELLKEAVTSFNSQSDQYRIEIIDYSSLNESPEDQSGKERYRLDIISGNTPDIYDLWSLPSPNFVAQGLVEDLYPFFQRDNTIPLDSLVNSVVSVAECDGGLYEIIPSFDILAVFCSSNFSEKINGKLNHSISALSEEYSAQDLFGTTVDREDFILRTLAYSGDSFVDLKSATCRFDSKEFLEVLEFAAQLPDTATGLIPPDSGVYSGLQQILMTTTGDIVNEYQYAETLFRGEAELIGFPIGSGSGVSIAPRLRIGMSSASENKDGVWEFIKFLLGDYFQTKAGGLRIRRDISEQIIHAQIEAAATSEKKIAVYNYDQAGNSMFDTLQFSPLPAGAEEKIWSYINSVDGTNEYDDVVFSLVMQEANRYYDGLCSSNEATEKIQKKVSLYLAEQYG